MGLIQWDDIGGCRLGYNMLGRRGVCPHLSVFLMSSIMFINEFVWMYRINGFVEKMCGSLWCQMVPST